MMDRPEWIDTFPHALTAIATLTNNNGAVVPTRPSAICPTAARAGSHDQA
jgi:secreted PhoX family phosphatase